MSRSSTTVPETQFTADGNISEAADSRIPSRDSIFRALAIQRGLVDSRPHAYPEIDESLLDSPKRVKAKYGGRMYTAFDLGNECVQWEENGAIDHKLPSEIRALSPRENKSVEVSKPKQAVPLEEVVDAPCLEEETPYESSNTVTPVKPLNIEDNRNNSVEKSLHKGSLTPKVSQIDYDIWVKHRIGRKWFPARITKRHEGLATIKYYGVEGQDVVPVTALTPLVPLRIPHPYNVELRYGISWHRVTVIEKFEDDCFMFEKDGDIEVRRGKTREVEPDMIEETPEVPQSPSHSHRAHSSSDDSTPEKTAKPRVHHKRPLPAAVPAEKSVSRQLFTEPPVENGTPKIGDVLETIPLKLERFEQDKGIEKEMTPKKSKTAPTTKSNFVQVKGSHKRPDSKNRKKYETVIFAEVLYRVPPVRKGGESYILRSSGILKEFLISELKCHPSERPIIIPRHDVNSVHVVLSMNYDESSSSE